MSGPRPVLQTMLQRSTVLFGCAHRRLQTPRMLRAPTCGTLASLDFHARYIATPSQPRHGRPVHAPLPSLGLAWLLDVLRGLLAARAVASRVGACASPPPSCRCTWWTASVRWLARPSAAGPATVRWWRCARKQVRASSSATQASADTCRTVATEADGVLRAELLRYVQRKLFAEDAGSQAAGTFTRCCPRLPDAYPCRRRRSRCAGC